MEERKGEGEKEMNGVSVERGREEEKELGEQRRGRKKQQLSMHQLLSGES